MLHKATKIIGFHIVASDGPIGHVDDLLIEEPGGMMRYLVIDTSNWVGGRQVLIPFGAIATIDPVEKRITVTTTREQIKSAPSVELADIPLAETLKPVWIM
jgi:uncharacterized protein YrrD